VRAGLLEREEHFTGAGGAELAGGEPGDDHRKGLLDRAGVAQGMEDVGGEGRGRVEFGRAGAVELFVVETVGARAVGGRLAEAARGHGMAAEGKLGLGPRVHWVPFVETETERLSPTLMIEV